MKVSIDTKEDRPEHIIKVIALLQSVVGNTSSGAISSDSTTDYPEYSGTEDYSESAAETPESNSGNRTPPVGIFNLFNDDEDNSSEETSSEDTDQNNENGSSYTIKEEKREPADPEEVPQVVEYDIV